MYDSASEEDGENIRGIVTQFFGGDALRLMGYWREGIHDAKTASKALIDEVLSFAAEKAGKIVDIDCGAGASTRSLLKWFPEDSITGIAAKKSELELCRRNVPRVAFLYRRLPRLKLAAAYFDLAVRIRGLEGSELSGDLLSEILRILKPGGQLICFESFRSAPPRKRRSFWTGRRDRVRTPERHAALLQKLGFEQVRTVDVTTECLVGFRHHVRDYFAERRRFGEIDAALSRKVENVLLQALESMEQCAIVSCRRSERPLLLGPPRERGSLPAPGPGQGR